MSGGTPPGGGTPPPPPPPPGTTPPAGTPGGAAGGTAPTPPAPGGAPTPPAPPAPPSPPGGTPTPPPRPPGGGAPAGPPSPGTPAAPGTPTAPGTGATPAVPGASAAGSGAILTFAVKAIKQVERKTMVFEYHREQAVTRQYAPQSLLGLMLDDLTGPGHFLEVDLDDPFFRTLDVEVSVTSAFEPIGLQSVAVALDYGDAAVDPQKHRHADLVFDAAHPQPQHWVVPIAGDYDLGYRPRIEYHFDPQSGWDAERNEVVVEPGRVEDRTLQLDPTHHIGFLSVDVRSDRLDPLEVASAEVVLTHVTGTGWTSTRHFEVRPGGETQAWRVRTDRRSDIAYSVQTTYHLVDGGTIVAPARDATATAVVVGSPFADHLVRRIDFAVPAGRFAQVVIDLSYDDGSYRATRRLELDGAGLSPARMQVGIVDPARRDTTTQATLLGADGEVVRGAPARGPGEFLTVAEDGSITGA
ncbi:hypothetical protein [Microbacterium sp.]|uniref:hypothetical protein n=1 Tax=Microbacterium sp. TaxID=51671 RepID=UPI00281187A2|nr:hypothetical protein [Microbacterium sp.]